MHLDHVAIAVRSVEAAATALCRTLGYTRRTEKVTNTRQHTNVLFLCKPGSLDIKLVEPSDEESPLREFVLRGGGLHHLAFKVPDVKAACDAMALARVRVVTPPEPGEAFDENLIAFLHVGFGTMIELIDTDARRALLDAALVPAVAPDDA